MKSSIRVILWTAGLGAVVSIVGAAEPAGRDPGLGEGRDTERRVFVRKATKPHERETVAFLGIETARVSPTLTAQLGLPEGAGLVVRTVVPESPAASVLEPHDILLKLDEQLLIESRQLATLIRHREDGDEVSLTYVRQGKQATAKVKLASHTTAKLSAFGGPGAGEDFLIPAPGRRVGHPDELNRMLSLLEPQERATFEFKHEGPPGPGKMPGLHAMRVLPENSNLVFTDDEGELALTIKDGKKTLLAKDAAGTAVFSGPVDTPEQRAALPARVRERLQQMETMDGVSFRASREVLPEPGVLEFAPHRIAVPHRRAISRPAPQPF